MKYSEPSHDSDGLRKFRFSVGCLIVSVYFLVLSFYVGKEISDFHGFTFLFLSAILLIVGCWQLDNSSRKVASSEPHRPKDKNFQPKKNNVLTLYR